MLEVDPKNRMNDLNSRAWLQFQKSWFICQDQPATAFIRFFTKAEYPDGHRGTVLLQPAELLQQVDEATRRSRTYLELEHLQPNATLDYGFFDATALCAPGTSPAAWNRFLAGIVRAAQGLRESAYLTVIARNHRGDAATLPYAWLLARTIGAFLTQKDEKIGCLEGEKQTAAVNGVWIPDDSILYFLNFRKEKHPIPERPLHVARPGGAAEPAKPLPAPAATTFTDAWFVWKPPPRPKDVILHPAKFPENLIEKYITTFTAPGEWVFDPMAGTGSALVAALDCGRKACGIELNADFVEIAGSRLPDSSALRLVTGDAAAGAAYQALPEAVDYCITSPPYWDMLRMKGAETQARRKSEGLRRWYSDDARDLGNVQSYEEFLEMLEAVYRRVADRLRPGRHMTIIVKNIKKQGRIYPLAWDLTERLQKFLVFCGEQFWCQDDQRLAPFGYRYAWVSNTFHHYCLTFRKPLPPETGSAG